MATAQRKHCLVIQPYGAAMVNGNTGQVDILNEVASKMLALQIDGLTPHEIAERLCQEYNVARDEVLSDLEEFSHQVQSLSASNGNNPLGYLWEVSGNRETTSVVQADLELTLACNQRCQYCFIEAGQKDIDELDVAGWKKIVSWLIDQGLHQATITGGDPLISLAFWPVVEQLSQLCIHTQIFTNGALVTKEVATRLSDLPINFVQVSLDASKPELHDRYRGRSFDRALKAINILRRHDVPVVIGASIFPDTVQEIEGLAKLASDFGAKLRCSAIDARGKAWTFDEKNTRNAQLVSKIDQAVEVASSSFDVFLDDVSSEMELDGEIHCKFFHGMVAVGSDGKMRPCLESKRFFEKVAPWAVDDRATWQLRNLEDHAAFDSVAQANEKHRPEEHICGSCQFLRYCEGCLLAGYNCLERR